MHKYVNIVYIGFAQIIISSSVDVDLAATIYELQSRELIDERQLSSQQPRTKLNTDPPNKAKHIISDDL